MSTVTEPPRHPRAEAEQRLDGRYEARVLEPSPPAVEDEWFADDPANPADSTGERPVVTPGTGGDVTWDELCLEDASLGAWCAARWLGAWRPLPSGLPDALVETRLALHAVAEHVLTPARHAANAKIGLRFTLAGFGTPFFRDGDGADRQLRVEAGRLVVQDGTGLTRHDLTTLRAAAEVSGGPLGAPTELFTPTTAGDPDAELAVDAAAAALLGDWYGFAASVLEVARTGGPAADPPGRVQLWPEHFDLAVDLGTQADGSRLTLGASPGDEPHPEPYLYALPWVDVDRGGFWSDPHFPGASLAYADLVAADDQRAAALDFFSRAVSELAEGEGP